MKRWMILLMLCSPLAAQEATKPAAAPAAKQETAKPEAPKRDFEKEIAALKTQADLQAKDNQINYEALHALSEFQNYLTGMQKLQQLQQQYQQLLREQAAAGQKK
jgi:hypothetical protein